MKATASNKDDATDTKEQSSAALEKYGNTCWLSWLDKINQISGADSNPQSVQTL
jgi:hypothetical protein